MTTLETKPIAFFFSPFSPLLGTTSGLSPVVETLSMLTKVRLCG
jgi:hypothetical protein